jgi:hypothetical protein
MRMLVNSDRFVAKSALTEDLLGPRAVNCKISVLRSELSFLEKLGRFIMEW